MLWQLKNVIYGTKDIFEGSRADTIERCDVVVPFASDILSFESPISISNEIEKGLMKDTESTSHLSVSASSSELYKEHTNRNYSTFYIGKILKQLSHIDQYKGFKASRDKEYFPAPSVFASTTEDLEVKPCKNVTMIFF